ncbi:nuclear transport factor 2 family protein [Colwelliaceae bacterium 6441]
MIKPLFLIIMLSMVMGDNTVDAQENNTVSASALAALQAYREAEQKYYNNRDLDGLMDVFAEDIIVRSVGQPTQKGRAALRKFFVQFWRDFEVTEIVEVVEDDIQELNGVLIVWAHYTVKMAIKADDPPKYEEGRILCVFKQGKDGKYRLWREAGLDKAPQVK